MSESSQQPTGLLRFLTIEGLWWLIVVLFKPLLSLAAGAVTLWSSIAHELPLWVLVPFTAVGFGSTLAGLNSLDDFFVRRAFKGRVSVFDAQIAHVLNVAGDKVAGYDVFLIFANNSDVPVEYKIIEVVADIEGRVIAEIPAKLLVGSIDPRGNRLHGVGRAKFDPDLKTAHIVGNVRVKFEYWRPGQRFGRHTKSEKFAISAEIDLSGVVQSNRAFHR